MEIPTLQPEEVEDLDLALGQEDINNAIMAMQSGTTPGLDGYPIEFYKKFMDKLTLVLLEMSQESFENESLPYPFHRHLFRFFLKKTRTKLNVDHTVPSHF